MDFGDKRPSCQRKVSLHMSFMRWFVSGPDECALENRSWGCACCTAFDNHLLRASGFIARTYKRMASWIIPSGWPRLLSVKARCLELKLLPSSMSRNANCLYWLISSPAPKDSKSRTWINDALNFKIKVAAGKRKSRTRKSQGFPCSQFSACLRSVERWLGATSSLAALPGCAWLLVIPPVLPNHFHFLGSNLCSANSDKCLWWLQVECHSSSQTWRASPIFTFASAHHLHNRVQPWPLWISTQNHKHDSPMFSFTLFQKKWSLRSSETGGSLVILTFSTPSTKHTSAGNRRFIGLASSGPSGRRAIPVRILVMASNLGGLCRTLGHTTFPDIPRTALSFQLFSWIHGVHCIHCINRSLMNQSKFYGISRANHLAQHKSAQLGS